LSWKSVEAAVAEAVAKGLLAVDPGGRWAPTELGLRFLNDLQAIFLPSPSRDRRPGG
jgi:oxygen-independent coproporphyrinogen-3 oxidase